MSPISLSRGMKSTRRLARSNAANGWEVCFIIIIVMWRDDQSHLAECAAITICTYLENLVHFVRNDMNFARSTRATLAS